MASSSVVLHIRANIWASLPTDSENNDTSGRSLVNTRCSIGFCYILVDTTKVQDLVVCLFFQACSSSYDYMYRRCRKITVRSANAC
jgi:hypothetical protein